MKNGKFTKLFFAPAFIDGCLVLSMVLRADEAIHRPSGGLQVGHEFVGLWQTCLLVSAEPAAGDSAELSWHPKMAPDLGSYCGPKTGAQTLKAHSGPSKFEHQFLVHSMTPVFAPL